MAIQLIVSQKGPLPIKVSFSAPGDMEACLVINGSVFATATNTMVGIQVALDGQNVGTAQIFSNGANTHRAAVPVYIPVKLAYGQQHTLTLSAMPNTTTDFNDFFTAVLDY
jgi:hypothetical protein